MSTRYNRVSEKPAHVDAQEGRQSSHPVMAIFGHTGKAGVRAVESSGIHSTHPLGSTLRHDHGPLQLPRLPAPCGHHLNAMAGYWRATKDAMGAGRCVSDRHQL